MTSSPFDAWIKNDDEVTSLLAQEWHRQTTTVQLIASENFTSPAVLAATGSILTNKYSEGYPGRRYYGGNQVVDEVEDLARRRLVALFGADHANVQPHAGRTPTWRSTRPSWSRATRSSPCASTRAVTSPTVRRRRSRRSGGTSSPTA